MEKIFKAKRLDNGEWVEFDLDTYSCHRKGCTPYVDKHFAHKMPINKNTICQYTGINDSEGNRIFESDQLSAKGEYNSIVKYGSGAFCIQHETDFYSNWVSFRDIDLKAYRLTGHNIHDKD